MNGFDKMMLMMLDKDCPFHYPINMVLKAMEDELPDCRARDLAATKLDECVFWIGAALMSKKHSID